MKFDLHIKPNRQSNWRESVKKTFLTEVYPKWAIYICI